MDTYRIIVGYLLNVLYPVNGYQHPLNNRLYLLSHFFLLVIIKYIFCTRSTSCFFQNIILNHLIQQPTCTCSCFIFTQFHSSQYMLKEILYHRLIIGSVNFKNSLPNEVISYELLFPNFFTLLGNLTLLGFFELLCLSISFK